MLTVAWCVLTVAGHVGTYHMNEGRDVSVLVFCELTIVCWCVVNACVSFRESFALFTCWCEFIGIPMNALHMSLLGSSSSSYLPIEPKLQVAVNLK